MRRWARPRKAPASSDDGNADESVELSRSRPLIRGAMQVRESAGDPPVRHMICAFNTSCGPEEFMSEPITRRIS